MSNRQSVGLGIAITAGFSALLLYLTLGMQPVSSSDVLADRDAVEGACTSEIRARFAGALLPFPARLSELDSGRYRLEGVVDATEGGQQVRRNYECIVQRNGPDEVRVDSLRLWQSH